MNYFVSGFLYSLLCLFSKWLSDSDAYGMWSGCAQLLQSCLTLCDPMDSSPPGSSVHGILQWYVIGIQFNFFPYGYPVIPVQSEKIIFSSPFYYPTLSEISDHICVGLFHNLLFCSVYPCSNIILYFWGFITWLFLTFDTFMWVLELVCHTVSPVPPATQKNLFGVWLGLYWVMVLSLQPMNVAYFFTCLLTSLDNISQ